MGRGESEMGRGGGLGRGRWDITLCQAWGPRLSP